MVHTLSGEWPFPGDAVRVNTRNPNDPNDLVGVTEFDRREEYINLIENEHPLMTLIQRCLSNSPSHRPTSSEVHQSVSAVAADHPPSFTNRVEMMDKIKTLSEQTERALLERDIAVTEKTEETAMLMAEKDTVVIKCERVSTMMEETQSAMENLCQSHSIEVEALQAENVDLKDDNEYLHATISINDKTYKAERETMKKDKQAMEQRYESNIKNIQLEKENLIKQHQQEIDLIKRNHLEEIEALKCSHQSDRQGLEQKYALHLKALEDEHQIVMLAMEQQYRAQLELKASELSAKDTLISSKTKTIRSLQIKLGQALGTSSKDNFSLFSPGVELIFTACAKVPQYVSGLDHGVVIGKNVYIGVDFKGEILRYNITENTWSPLPTAPVRYARMGCLYKKILLVGGRLPPKQVTADIHEFDEASQLWIRSTSIPPMLTPRQAVTAVSWSTPAALIVCGGYDQEKRPVTIVDVYHSRTSQWHTVSPLPLPRSFTTHVINQNMLYLVGGYEGTDVNTYIYKKKVVCTSIPQLLDSCLQPSPHTQWQSLVIPDIPYCRSTAASLGGCLVVVGGVKDHTFPPKPKSIVSSMHAYCPSSSSWVLVGELPQPLYDCITATLPTGELLVIGGISPSGDHMMATNKTYKFSLSVSI